MCGKGAARGECGGVAGVLGADQPDAVRGAGDGSADGIRLVVYGKYDPTFLPELTQEMLRACAEKWRRRRGLLELARWGIIRWSWRVQLCGGVEDVYLFFGALG